MIWGKLGMLFHPKPAPTTMDSFWREAYRSFLRTQGIVFTFLGFAASVWAIALPAPFTVDVRFFGLLAIVCWIIAATAVDLAVRALGSVNEKPKVIVGRQADNGFQFIMEPHRAFSHDSVVSVFSVEGDFEVGIGWGRVVSVQDSGRIQVLMEDVYGQDELWRQICQPNRALIRALIVKPTLPSAALRP